MYLTELHCHTGEVSDCGRAMSEEVVGCYIDAGYDSITVTNHLSAFTFNGKQHKYTGDKSWEARLAFYMSGIERVRRAARGRLNVLWGVELRINENGNDYLVYGISCDFLRANPDLLDITVKEASKRIHRAGGFIYQAHPFRNFITVTRPELLDGIEVYNGHFGHDSRNDIALMWARKYGLRMISGSDFHYTRQLPDGGILTEKPIRTNAELLNVLRSGKYQALNCGLEPKNAQYK